MKVSRITFTVSSIYGKIKLRVNVCITRDVRSHGIINANRECQVTKVHAGTHESFGHKYQVGDIVGCFIDVADRTIDQ